MSSGFDRLARPYRWLEYLSCGPALQRRRLHFLHQLTRAHRALVLGDGDGRFTERLLLAAPDLTVDAVDISQGMLRQMRLRCRRSGVEGRLRTHCLDATATLPSGGYDLIVSHFFLDCLTTQQVTKLARCIQRLALPGAAWVVSEFAVPANLLRLPAALLIRSLYLAFRVLTGLEVQHLPDHAAALAGSGLRLTELYQAPGGLLRSELWHIDSVAHEDETRGPDRQRILHSEVHPMSTIPNPDSWPADLPPTPFPPDSPNQPPVLPEPEPLPEPVSPTLPVF